MNTSDETAAALSEVESLMLESFQKEPFHNLRVLYCDQVSARVPGGPAQTRRLASSSWLGAEDTTSLSIQATSMARKSTGLLACV